MKINDKSTKDIFYTVVILLIIFMSGFEVGILSKPIFQMTNNINSGNYTIEIGDKLHEILNKNHTTISESNTTALNYNSTMRVIST